MNILEFAVARQMGGSGGVPINNQDKTITQNGTYIADEGFTGLGTVKVNVARDDQTDIAKQLDGIIDRSITEISSNSTGIGDYTFIGCSKLNTVDFPAATSIGRYTFSDCSKLTTVDFPAATSIGESAFEGCSNLTTVSFPVATSIGGSAFRSCSELTTVSFPVATSIDAYAFRSCSKLTTADFPVATDIKREVFRSCSNLTALILSSETMCTLFAENVFTSTPIASGTGYIYVPRALVDSYKADSTWSTFASQFRALEDYTVDGTITGALDESKI